MKETIKSKIKHLEYCLDGWQGQLQNPTLSRNVEFIQYCKTVVKISKEIKYLRSLLDD
tara:strand:- start:1816 stop:1989 length:174 start_codon:yes stop_codon:yes gene_type:complete